VRIRERSGNTQRLLLGRADPGLDDEGRLQASRLAAALGPLDEARVVTSPLARCRQTAEVIVGVSEHEVPVDVDEAWIELDYGAFDGLGAGDVPADTWAAWRADVAWAPEGGESLAALGARVRSACESLAEEARERDVVVVTHVSPVKAAVAWSLGVGDEVAWRMWVGPASISRIGFAGWSPSLRSFNEVAHLT